jgi:hypothetical protein
MEVSGQLHAPTGERTPGTHCTGGWVGPRAGLDKEARGKILCPCQGSNPDGPVFQSVVRHYTDWVTSVPSRPCAINKSGVRQPSDLIRFWYSLPATGWSLVQRSPTLCLCMCDHRNTERGPSSSWELQESEWINEIIFCIKHAIMQA